MACPPQSDPGLPLRSCSGASPNAHRAGPSRDCLDDVMIAGAATQVAIELFADRSLVKITALALHDIDRCHDHPRGTKTTLQAMIVPKSFLHWVQTIWGCKSL